MCYREVLDCGGGIAGAGCCCCCCRVTPYPPISLLDGNPDMWYRGLLRHCHAMTRYDRVEMDTIGYERVGCDIIEYEQDRIG